MSISDEKYVLITTFRKNGDAVSSPVWIAPLADGTAGFTTEDGSGKVKRIRNNPRVTLQPCSVKGTVKHGSAVVEASAAVLLGVRRRAHAGLRPPASIAENREFSRWRHGTDRAYLACAGACAPMSALTRRTRHGCVRRRR